MLKLSRGTSLICTISMCYKAATDCHELVRRLREKQKEDPRWVVEVGKGPGINRLTHLFRMTLSQVEAASRFNYLVIHDNTRLCNCTATAGAQRCLCTSTHKWYERHLHCTLQSDMLLFNATEIALHFTIL